MVLSIVSGVLIVVGLAAIIYSLMSSKPQGRRKTAQKVYVVAIAGVLFIEAYTRTGWMRWMNLGVAAFCLSSLLIQAALDRRKGSRGEPLAEPRSA